MIQIYIHNGENGGFLDLPTDATLTIEAMQAAFDEDFSIGEFSLPVDIPWTANNRKILGFSERVENLILRSYYWRCDVYESGWPEIVNGKFSILEKNGALSYQRGSFSASIAGTKGLFGSQIKKKKLKDADMGGVIDWSDTGYSSRELATKVMNGEITTWPYIRFAPVVCESFFDTDNRNYTDEFLARDTMNDIVVSEAVGGTTSWTFDRPKSTDSTQAAPPSTSEYLDYRTVPFFSLKYVLRKVFSNLGYNLSGDMIDDAQFDKLVLFNNFGIEVYDTNLKYDKNQQITPANHLPDVFISDFLKGIFTFFGVYPTWPTLTDVQLRYRNRNFTDKTICSLNGKVNGDFNSTLEAEPAVGYTLGYTWDDNDQYHTDMAKEDLTDKTLLGTVPTYADMATFVAPTGTDLNTNCLLYVQAENLFYAIADATSNPVKWEVYSEGLTPFIKVEGTVYGPADTLPDDTGDSVDLLISTLAQYAETDETTQRNTRRNKLATSQPGGYISRKGVKVPGKFGIRIFYLDVMPDDNGHTVPVSYNHNQLRDGTATGDLSLALTVAGGLRTLHEKWQDFRLNPEIVKINLIADKKIMAEIDSANILELNNVQFLPYQINRDIPNSGTVEVQMVPI